ncbi:MAG TPA: hypothetical protein VEJ86_06430 [Candidatus Binataceae bacterium]|nr:hypothetical protein [Candidatus Binataceae bacterium]
MSAVSIPTISAIQRTNVILVAVSALTLARVDSAAAAVGCLLGGAVVIANLYVLAGLGSVLLAIADGGGGAAAKLGMLAFPFKLLLVVGLIYLLFSRAHVDGVGFGAGILTQLLAVIIETGRAAVRAGGMTLPPG